MFELNNHINTQQQGKLKIWKQCFKLTFGLIEVDLKLKQGEGKQTLYLSGS